LANQLLTISTITNRSLPVLANELIVTDKFNRQYDKEFGQKGKKIGATCNIRLPPRYLGTFGPALNVEPSTEEYVPVSILYQYHVDIQFNTINMLLDIDEFEDRFIKPACITAANVVDSYGAYFAMQNTANRQGTPGTPPGSSQTAQQALQAFTNARAQLVAEGMPKGLMPVCVLHPFANASLTPALANLYNPQMKISEQYETGLVALKTAGADWFEDANIPNYTTGRLNGTPVVNSTAGSAWLTSGWAQTGVLTLSGLTTSSAEVVVGDTIQIATVYPVNPQNRSKYGTGLKQFVVLPPGGYSQQTGALVPGGPQFASATLTNGTFSAATGIYTSSSGGLLDLTIGECVITGGQFQNCVIVGGTTIVGAAVTVNGGATYQTSSTENLYFQRDAYAMAFVDLPLPRTAVEASRAYDEDLGIALRICTQYTINNDAEPTRIDLAFGFNSLYRSLGVRISG
jgi:P22 coat protein - gene protein 5